MNFEKDFKRAERGFRWAIVVYLIITIAMIAGVVFLVKACVDNSSGIVKGITTEVLEIQEDIDEAKEEYEAGKEYGDDE